jgi:phosphohistidine phosphatase
MKSRLILMRHAKSDWTDEHCTDFDRPLTARGQKAANKMGIWLKQQSYDFDRIVCSPAVRARQTCQHVLKKLHFSHSRVIWEPAIYEASLKTLITLIDRHSQNVRTLLMIGHNPGLDQLLCHLSIDPPAVNQSGKLLTTAAIAVLEYDHGGITIKPHQARLRYFIRPKELNFSNIH